MSERKEVLCCAFDKKFPCPNECGLHNFQLRMKEKYSIAPDVVSEFIVDCPPRQEEGGFRTKREENGAFLKQDCLHFKNK